MAAFIKNSKISKIKFVQQLSKNQIVQKSKMSQIKKLYKIKIMQNQNFTNNQNARVYQKFKNIQNQICPTIIKKPNCPKI